MGTEILTVVFVLGLPLWLVAEELVSRVPVRAKAEWTPSLQRVAVRTAGEHVGG